VIAHDTDIHFEALAKGAIMNRLLYVLIALVLTASATLAVEPPPNDGHGVLCILTAPDPPFENHAQGVVSQQTIDLYFVLYHPLAPSGFIGAADFGWVLDPLPSFAIMASGGPGGTINIGTPQEPILGFGDNAPVSDGHALLYHVQLIFLGDPGMTSCFLHPNGVEPSVPAQMTYVDLEDPAVLQPMLPYAQDDSFANPVFGVNTVPVATESVVWGAVKALFE